MGIPHIAFFDLFDKWRDDTKFMSSTNDMKKSEFYQQIIDNGDIVLEPLFTAMGNGHSFLFLAADEITGANPVPPEHAGYIQKIVDDWLQWATQNGYR